MIRSYKDYDKMAKLVIDLYVDYGIKTFPIDPKDICKKIGIKLVPYSAYTKETISILIKKSMDAFFVPATKSTPNTIFYNDTIKSKERIRFSIFHEIKHFVNGDKEDCDFNDEMANYFARYFMAPVPYLIKIGVNDVSTLISDFGMSYTASVNCLKNIHNRIAKYGSRIFNYEKPLIDLLYPKI